MRLNLVKVVGVAVGVAAIFLLLASPIVSAGSLACTKVHDVAPCPEGAMAPLHFSHCALAKTAEVTKQVILPNRLTRSEDVGLSLSLISLTTESSPDKSPFQGDTVQVSPPRPRIAYHCRNVLVSEEPPL